jgi:hypothetical protein
MYSERFSLPFIAGVAMDAAERVRPGLGPWSDAVREQLRALFVRELEDIKPRFQELFHDEDYWRRVEHTVLNECFPRYAALAQQRSTAEATQYGIWRGGDLLARGAFALGGLVVGAAMVYLPFIPIPRTWEFVILLTMFGAPFIPDAQIAFAERRFRNAHAAILADVQRAQEVDRLYEPLPTSLPDEQQTDAADPARVDSKTRSGLKER